MRNGFTTGSCAQAAAKAAAYMLFTKSYIKNVSIITPAKVKYEPSVENAEIGTDYALCAIRKDSGDDPDITNGILIFARVSIIDDNDNSQRITLKAGKGIGKITRPGLEMPVGDFAINSTPRKMIIEEVREVMEQVEYEGSLLVEIYAPEGEEIARKTFNPHMGIVDGISILGTSGIVVPMSNEAIIKTIEIDLNQKKSENEDAAIMVPGNYGEVFLKNNYGINPKRIVHFSNFIGISIDKAVEVGFKKILIAGHTGKLVKVSGGIMNTHSKEADCRMELMSAAILEASRKYNKSISTELLLEVLDQVTTTGVLSILQREDLLREVSEVLLEKIHYNLCKRAGEGVQVEVILYENSFGLLAKTENVENLL